MELPWRLSDVLSRLRFDLNRLLSRSGERELDLASGLCASCGNGAECDRWIAGHLEGEDNAPPRFCPNSALLNEYAARSTLKA